jgi:hypothetical protein
MNTNPFNALQKYQCIDILVFFDRAALAHVLNRDTQASRR